jgi:hypothetical protein
LLYRAREPDGIGTPPAASLAVNDIDPAVRRARLSLISDGRNHDRGRAQQQERDEAIADQIPHHDAPVQARRDRRTRDDLAIPTVDSMSIMIISSQIPPIDNRDLTSGTLRWRSFRRVISTVKNRQL